MVVTCTVCDGTEFTVEGGFYYCNECHTQTQELREECLDIGERYRDLNIHKTHVSKKPDATKEEQWTTWEGYNYIMIGLVDEMINLGVPENFKLTTLQLWSAYLTTLEVAFTSKKSSCLPKLSAIINTNDVLVMYGRSTPKRKRSKHSKSDLPVNVSANSSPNPALSQSLHDLRADRRKASKTKRQLVNADYEARKSESETNSLHSYSAYSSSKSSTSNQSQRLQISRVGREAKLKQISRGHLKFHRQTVKDCHKFNCRNAPSSFLSGPYHLSPAKIYAILYLSLLLTKAEMQLGDMLRYMREGRLTVASFKHFFPENMAMCDKFKKYSHNAKPSLLVHHSIRLTAARIAKVLAVKNIPTPNIVNLCERYVIDLQLPRQIFDFIKDIINLSPPRMPYKHGMTKIPNYEARAMSYVIFSLKYLLGIDDKTENNLSELAGELNALKLPRNSIDTEEQRLRSLIATDDLFIAPEFNEERPLEFFHWNNWVEFIEFRKVVLARKHFPTMRQLQPDALGGTDLFIDFWNKEKSKYDYHEETRHNMHIFTFKKIFHKLRTQIPSSESIFNFAPSLTPSYSYFTEILHSPAETRQLEIPEKMNRIKFQESDIRFLLNPKEYVLKLPTSENVVVKSQSAVVDYDFEDVFKQSNESTDSKIMAGNTMVAIKHYSRRLLLNEDVDEGTSSGTGQRTVTKRLNRRKSILDDISSEMLTRCVNRSEVEGSAQPDARRGKKSKKKNANNAEIKKYFQPASTYWLFLGVFRSNINCENFKATFEKLPTCFKWLLSECARALEMTIKDMYMELVDVEVYLGYVLKDVIHELQEEYNGINNEDIKYLMNRTKRNW